MALSKELSDVNLDVGPMVIPWDNMTRDELTTYHGHLAEAGGGEGDRIVLGNIAMGEELAGATDPTITNPDHVKSLIAVRETMQAKTKAVVAPQLFMPGPQPAAMYEAKGVREGVHAFLNGSPLQPKKLITEITAEDMTRYAKQYREGIERVLGECGFESFEIHGAHGYLISAILGVSEFDRPIENCIEMLKPILDAAVKAADGKRISMKINLTDVGFKKDDPEVEAKIKKTLERATFIADYLASIGIDIIYISGGNYLHTLMLNQSFRNHLQPIADVVGNRAEIGVIGRNRSEADIAEAVRNGAKRVGFSRPALATPGFISKVRNGDIDEEFPIIDTKALERWPLVNETLALGEIIRTHLGRGVAPDASAIDPKQAIEAAFYSLYGERMSTAEALNHAGLTRDLLGSGKRPVPKETLDYLFG